MPMLQSRRAGAVAVALLLSLGVAGCKTSSSSSGTAVGSHGGIDITGSTGHSGDEVRQAVSAWGQRYEQAPGDRTTILNYAAALRLSGQTDQAVAVLNKGKLAFPQDQEMSAAYGKALADNGDLEQALAVIRAAQKPDRPDWKLYSAEGAILDQMGDTSGARDRYKRALDIAPGEPSVVNNLALSHLLSGDIDAAEKLLRQAAQRPTANSRIRQNLALVLGLQGRFAEAEAVARNELDPAQSAANVAYLKSMLSQANTWKEIKANDPNAG